MDLIGQTIRHRTFGAGVVTGQAEDTVTVLFRDNERKFIYPDAFVGFLVLKDRETQKEIEKHIRERDAAILAAKQAGEAEREKRRRLLNFSITANSHAVFNIPPEKVGETAGVCRVSTGTYLSGGSKGLPRVPERMKPNSVCLLTVRPAGREERERRIVGAFMVRDDFFGEDAADGVIEGHPLHRVILPERDRPLFWEYTGPDAPPRWGNTSFKYCSEDTAGRILADMAELTRDAEFYRYFCKINRLRPLIGPDEDESEENR